MRSSVEPVEGTEPKKMVKLSVEVDEKEFEVALDAAFRRIAREVRIPGFRPGKAPRKVLEARVGKGYARQEALREALPGYYAEALRDHEVDAIAQPEIAITAGEEEGPITFDATVEVRPLVPIEGYGGLVATVPSPEVTDDDVERQLNRLRSADATLVEVERPAQPGDVLTIDLKATKTHVTDEDTHEDTLDDVEDYSYELGDAPGFPPEVEVQLTGASVGETKVFDATTGEGDDAQTIHFTITVKKVQDKQLPELTDEWAADSSELETVEALRADLRDRLQKGRRMACQMALRDGAVAELVKLVPDDHVPEVMVMEEVNRRAGELDQRLRQQGANLEAYIGAVGGADVLIAQLREQAFPTVKADLALRALAEAEGFGADEDEVEAELARIAAAVGQPVAQVRGTLERNDGMQAVRSDIRKAKALEWLVEHVEAKDPDGNPIDREALMAQDEAVEDDDTADDDTNAGTGDSEEQE